MPKGERTGIKNLRVKYNKVFGYYLEVTKSYLNMVPEDYIREADADQRGTLYHAPAGRSWRIPF